MQLRRRQTNLAAAESAERGYLLTGYDQYERNFEIACDALLFAAAVAMRTERIRIGFAVVQLPFHHPVLLAVQLALLDNLSKGDVEVHKGTIYNEYEFVGHGLLCGRCWFHPLRGRCRRGAGCRVARRPR